MIKYREEIFTTRFHRIIYAIPSEQYQQKIPFFNSMKEEFPQLELILSLPKESDLLDNSLPKLLILGEYYLKI